MTPIRVNFTIFLSLIVIHGCSKNDDPAKLQDVPSGHTLLLDGVAHAHGANKAPRYCALCHGDNLEGSEIASRSCYSCHGKMWSDIDNERSFAPISHTIIHQGFRHEPTLNTPIGYCSECHGEDLNGDNNEGIRRGSASTVPGCLTCHIDLWSH